MAKIDERVKSSGDLSFGHTRAAIVGVGAVALLLASLAWLDHMSGQKDLERLRHKICKPLPDRLLEALGRISGDAEENDEAILQARAVLNGLLDNREERFYIRIAIPTVDGWSEWGRWGARVERAFDPRWDRIAKSGNCDGSLRDGWLRVERSFVLPGGDTGALVVRMKRE